VVELRLVVSAEADADLATIGAYITEHDGRARAAMVTECIQKTMRSLASMPGMGRRWSYLNRDSRLFPVPPWVIVYMPLPEGNGIEVVRVIHGRRDLPAIFGRSKKKR